jgi:hypothetical protein
VKNEEEASTESKLIELLSVFRIITGSPKNLAIGVYTATRLKAVEIGGKKNGAKRTT